MGKERGIYKFPLHLAIIFLLLSTGICVSGYLYYERQKQHFKEKLQDELSAIADLKVKQIVNWREERLGDAETIFNNHLIVSHVRQWLKGESPTIEQEILVWMKSLQKHYRYKSIILLDTKANIRLGLPDGKEVLGQDAKRFFREAINTKKIFFSDLYRSKTTKVTRLTLVVPLLATQGRDNIPVGVLLFRIDPYQFLYPLIQSWPAPSETAESFLIRREGKEVVFLNKLRHQKNADLNLRFPVREKNLPAAMAARGIEGVVEGIDYRGVPVIADLRPVPNTSWLLVTKMDISEVYAPLREKLWEMIILIGALLISAGAGIGFRWRQQISESYKKQYKTEHERQMYVQRYEYLTRYANDIILLAGRDGQIKDFNERAVAAYGYSGDELLQKNLKDLHAPETKALLNGQIKKVEEHNGLVFETLHQRKDGTTFPIEVSSRIIQIDGNKYYQSIGRDISERKKAKEELIKEKAFTESALNTLSDIFFVFDRNGKFLRWNKAGNTILGYTDEEISAMRPKDFFAEEDVPQVTEAIETVMRKGNASVEVFFVTKDNKRIPYEIFGSLLKDPDGNYIGICGVGRDITDRKKFEDELRKREEELKKRVKELEDFYEMGIGRELRMIELKKEIESLKEELVKYKKDGNS